MLMVAPLEFAARAVFYEPGAAQRSCLVTNDASTGVRGIPNAVCRDKIAESEWAEYRFNKCGDRSSLECGAKPVGAYRIVLVGSSLAEGYTVASEHSFAGILPQLLSKNAGRYVQLYNQGMEWGTPHRVALRFGDTLALQPDLILWPITPWDVYEAPVILPRPEPRNQSRWSSSLAVDLRGIFMLKHFFLQKEGFFMRQSLLKPDIWVPSMQDDPGEDWRKRLRRFEAYYSEVAFRSKMAGVPLVIVVIPRHTQALMIASGQHFPGLDPYAFGNQVRTIVEVHGGIYVDILPNFRSVANLNSGFYALDPHMNEAGHSIVARILSERLSDGIIPALAKHGRPAAHLAETTTETKTSS